MRETSAAGKFLVPVFVSLVINMRVIKNRSDIRYAQVTEGIELRRTFRKPGIQRAPLIYKRKRLVIITAANHHYLRINVFAGPIGKGNCMWAVKTMMFDYSNVGAYASNPAAPPTGSGKKSNGSGFSDDLILELESNDAGVSERDAVDDSKKTGHDKAADAESMRRDAEERAAGGRR